MEEQKRLSDSKNDGKEVLLRFQDLYDQRKPFHNVWENVAALLGPAFLGFGSSSVALEDKITVDELLTDTTAKRAATIFAAGMLSGVSSPSQRWFTLRFEDQELEKYQIAKRWIQQVEDLHYNQLSQFAFYREQHHAYLMAGLFGWQALLLEEADPSGAIIIKSLPLPQVFIAENHLGTVDVVYRKFGLTPRQAVQKFGYETLPRRVQVMYDKTMYKGNDNDAEMVQFIHAVFPREDRNEKFLTRNNLKYASMYVLESEGQVIREGGYRELPYIVSRSFRIPGTAYSYSPGTEALADVKMINEMKRLILEAGQMAVAPPYMAPDDGFVNEVNYEPWAINYYKKFEGHVAQDFVPMQVGADPRFAFELLTATKDDINAAFFVDLFLAITNRQARGQEQMTAMEVSEVAAERMFLLGPLLINQQLEGFQNLFGRLYNISVARRELPPAPRDIQGKSFKTMYTSPLVTAQMESQTRALLKAYTDIGIIATVDPSVFDNFNHDEATMRILGQRGIPQIAVRDPQERDEIRQARMQQEQQAAMEAKLLEASKVAPGLAKAPEEGSPMDGLKKAYEQQSAS